MGSLTLLFRQPVAALQVLTRDGHWKWVRPQTDALTVNIADALQFLTSQSCSELRDTHFELTTSPILSKTATSSQASTESLPRLTTKLT